MNFPHASKAFKALNPELFANGILGGPAADVVQRPRRKALGRQLPAQEVRPGGMGKGNVAPFLVSIACVLRAHRARRTDLDNIINGYKWLRDAIAGSLGMDDHDSQIEWSYSVLETTGREGTLVTIERRS